MRLDNLLRYAVRILNAYSGDMPLQGWLKNFFRENPQMGSRDRKQVAEMVYCYFRLGHTLKEISKEERIITGLFLTNNIQEDILAHLDPAWHAQTEFPLVEKLAIVNRKFPEFDVLDIFPWKNLLSAGVDHRTYCLSFLERPKLFIRIRPGREKTVLEKLNKNQIVFQNADPDALLPFKSLSFPITTKLDGVFVMNYDAVIQDLHSQRTALFLKKENNKVSEAWDCCSGSGGKSIMMNDLNPGCRLTVSDIRESILNNLQKRFKEAGISSPVFFKADLTDKNDLPKTMFTFIIADLPCTGSGTWSRNPESLFYFDPQNVSNFRQRQEKILGNIIGRLKPGGVLVYITCSVFADENEHVSAVVSRLNGMENIRKEMMIGCDLQADSLFASKFIRH